MWPNPQETADLVAFTEEILNENLHFFAQWLLLILVLFLVIALKDIFIFTTIAFGKESKERIILIVFCPNKSYSVVDFELLFSLGWMFNRITFLTIFPQILVISFHTSNKLSQWAVYNIYETIYLAVTL